jgi:hypothetical protein
MEGCRGDAYVGAFLLKSQVLKEGPGSVAGLESLLEANDDTGDPGNDLYDVGTFANVSLILANVDELVFVYQSFF